MGILWSPYYLTFQWHFANGFRVTLFLTNESLPKGTLEKNGSATPQIFVKNNIRAPSQSRRELQLMLHVMGIYYLPYMAAIYDQDVHKKEQYLCRRQKSMTELWHQKSSTINKHSKQFLPLVIGGHQKRVPGCQEISRYKICTGV